LKSLPAEEQTQLLRSLAAHEATEYQALNTYDSEIGKQFTAYLSGTRGLRQDRVFRTPDNFHAFLEQAQTPAGIDGAGQKKLLEYARSAAASIVDQSVFTRTLNSEAIEKAFRLPSNGDALRKLDAAG